jgi:hypothetical protein
MFAPVVIFCYRRLDTLKLSIESLLQCKESSETDIIIFSDAAVRPEDVASVDEVRSFLHTLNSFNSITIRERIFNHGIDNNIIEGLIEISNKFDRFIIVEDDIIVNPSFLTFMNCALSFYEKNKYVSTISGFNYVKKIPKDYNYDIYFAQRINAWGWATWSDRIKDVVWDLKNISLSFSKFPNYINFNKWGSDRSNMLRKTINGKIRTWDIRIDYHQFLQNQYTVYPILSLCNNIGFQGIGATNTFGYNRYQIEFINTIKDSWCFSKEIFIESNIKREFIHKNSITQRIKTKLINKYRSLF